MVTVPNTFQGCSGHERRDVIDSQCRAAPKSVVGCWPALAAGSASCLWGSPELGVADLPLNPLQCDGKVPACTRCVDAGVSCVGFDSSTQKEAPRSIADFLEMHIASLEGDRSPPMRPPGVPGSALHSPATYQDSDAQHEKGTYADKLVNLIMKDITPSFLGVSKSRPLLSCVVKGTQLPSKTDLDENHPRSIMNPQPTTMCLESFDEKTAKNLFRNYLDHVITQYPIYHRNDVTTAFNSIYYAASNPGQDSPRNRYIISLIMAISLSTAARTKQKVANAIAYSFVQKALQLMPEVATNDISGLQAILLLTQYIFLNPSMADVWLLTGLISQAVVDLGLHQELPNDARISAYQRDMRRRLFWVAWEMEVAVCSIFSRPISLPTRRYDVAFPVQVDDTAITEAGIDFTGRVSKFTSKRIWLFRQIEAEIISVLYQNDRFPPECASLEDWMQRIVTSITEWHHEVYQAARENTDRSFDSRWGEMKLYSDIAHPYILLLIYRPSKRNPQPTNEHWMIAFTSAIEITKGYFKQSNASFGNIKYVFHPCHHCFNAATTFLQALSRCKVEISEKFDWRQIEAWMGIFSTFFSTIAERWPAATRCLEEYERLLDPIKREYMDFLAAKAERITQQSPALGVVVHGLYDNGIATTELGDAFSFWTAINPTTTADMTDAAGAYSFNAPQDWSTEFSLNFNAGMEVIPDATRGVDAQNPGTF